MQKLNTTLVYILSIVGFLCCCFWGLGLLSSIIAFVIATKELKKYAENPNDYVNGPAMKTAKTIALIAIIVSGMVSAYQAYTYLSTTDEERALQEEQAREQLEEMGIELPW